MAWQRRPCSSPGAACQRWSPFCTFCKQQHRMHAATPLQLAWCPCGDPARAAPVLGSRPPSCRQLNCQECPACWTMHLSTCAPPAEVPAARGEQRPAAATPAARLVGSLARGPHRGGMSWLSPGVTLPPSIVLPSMRQPVNMWVVCSGSQAPPGTLGSSCTARRPCRRGCVLSPLGLTLPHATPVSVPCSQAAFSDDPPVVYSADSSKALRPPPPRPSGQQPQQQQQTLQPALSQVRSPIGSSTAAASEN
jgi:hypothetical protein